MPDNCNYNDITEIVNFGEHSIDKTNKNVFYLILLNEKAIENLPANISKIIPRINSSNVECQEEKKLDQRASVAM